jgi:carbon-monoxide dehydrogenase medium subunit
LNRIKGLDLITFDAKQGLTIRATALLADVASHTQIKRKYPAIAYAAAETANVQIRNMGTVVGNLCNAAPSAENAPTLMAMNGEVTLVSLHGERRLPLDEFFKGPGKTAMKPEEMMTSIHVPPPPPKTCSSYQHISARGKVDISAVGVGTMVTFDGQTCKDVRIVLGAVAPVPMRAKKTEKLLRGKKWTEALLEKASDQASRESKPISDVRASAAYRKRMVTVLTRRALLESQKRAQQK